MYKFLLVFFLCICFSVTHAQKLPSIEDRVSGLKKIPGYMDIYWDEVNGRLFLEISKLDTELLYVVSLPAGLGQMTSDSIVVFQMVDQW